MKFDGKVTRVSVEITDVCNLRCSFCYNMTGNHHGKDVDTEKIIGAIDFLKSEDTEVILSGGEPILHKNLEILLQKLGDMNIKSIRMISNITMAKDEILDLLKKYNVKLQISFYHDKTMFWNKDKHIYHRQLEVIEQITKKNLPELSFRCMIYKNNIDSIDDIINTALNYDIKQIYFERVHQTGYAKRNSDIVLSTQEQYNIYKLLLHNQKKYEDSLDIQVFGLHSGLCGLHSEQKEWKISLSSDGSVYPCNALAEKQFALGNYFTEDWELIFSEDRMNKVRQSLTDALRPCEKCTIRSRCMPPCPGGSGGNRNEFDNGCGLRKILCLTNSYTQKKEERKI